MDQILALWERFSEHEDFYSILSGAIGIIAAITFYLVFLKLDEEEAVPYDVTLPEQARPDWKGEVLSQPSLKVSFIQYIDIMENSLTRPFQDFWLLPHPMLQPSYRRSSRARQSELR